MKTRHALSTAMLALAAAFAPCLTTAQNVPFFDTGAPDKPFGVGVRVGVNSSNQTRSSNGLTSNLDSWGTGMDVGAVFDINIRDFLTIQPGFYFDIKNNKYCHSTTVYDAESGALQVIGNEGKTHHTTFTVPVLASVRFNISSRLRWQLDCGPYFQFGLGGSDKGDHTTFSNAPSETASYAHYDVGYYDLRKKFDWGLKIGTALRVMDHYYIGVHYEGGFCHVYKDPSFAGHNKSWTISLGYDF